MTFFVMMSSTSSKLTILIDPNCVQHIRVSGDVIVCAPMVKDIEATGSIMVVADHGFIVEQCRAGEELIVMTPTHTDRPNSIPHFNECKMSLFESDSACKLTNCTISTAAAALPVVA
jgi:hypothetical protein